MQEEEREKKMETLPDKSVIDTENLVVDETVSNMLNELGLDLDVQVDQADEE